MSGGASNPQDWARWGAEGDLDDGVGAHAAGLQECPGARRAGSRAPTGEKRMHNAAPWALHHEGHPVYKRGIGREGGGHRRLRIRAASLFAVAGEVKRWPQDPCHCRKPRPNTTKHENGFRCTQENNTEDMPLVRGLNGLNGTNIFFYFVSEARDYGGVPRHHPCEAVRGRPEPCSRSRWRGWPACAPRTPAAGRSSWRPGHGDVSPTPPPPPPPGA